MVTFLYNHEHWFCYFLLHIACNISWNILIFYCFVTLYIFPFPILSFPFCLPFCFHFCHNTLFSGTEVGRFAHWRQHHIFTKKGLIMLNIISVMQKRQNMKHSVSTNFLIWQQEWVSQVWQLVHHLSRNLPDRKIFVCILNTIILFPIIFNPDLLSQALEEAGATWTCPFLLAAEKKTTKYYLVISVG